MIKISEPARKIFKRLNAKGYQGLIVGGAVRDDLLGKIPGDIDILTNASLKEICSLFDDQNVEPVGRTFPICMVNGIEVSTARDNADDHPFYSADLGRRDFTINAMAYDPESQQVMDPYNGKKDLLDRIIRFTGDPEKRIDEDPIRIVRACRFAAMIQGKLSRVSGDAVISSRDLLNSTIALERVGQEVVKAMCLDKPSLFFKTLKQCRLLSRIFPSLDRCFDLDGGPYHGETVFEHCMLTGDAVSNKFPILRLAGFLHDAGKFDAAVMKSGHPDFPGQGKPYLSFPGHEKHTKAVMDDLERLRFSNKDRGYIQSVIFSHMRPLKPESTPKSVRRLLAMLDEYQLDYQDFMRMRIADKKSNLKKRGYYFPEIRLRLEKLYREMKKNTPSNTRQLAVTGNDIMQFLNLNPGPEVGRIKQQLFEKVLDDPGLNTYENLKNLCLSMRI